MAMLPSLHFDTRPMRRAEAFDVFRARMAVAFDITLQAPDTPFLVASETRLLGQILISGRRTAGIVIDRSANRIRRDGIDHYLLSLRHRGSWAAEAGGTNVAATSGQVLVVDMARPVREHVADNISVGFTIPRDELDARLPAGSLRHGMAIPGGAGLLLADYLASLERRARSLLPSEAPLIEKATYDMIAACMSPSRDLLEQAQPLIAGSLRSHAKRVVEARLHDPRLTPEAVAAELRVSRATLYRLFEADGGVAAFIRDQRLRRAARLLSDAAERRRIAQIAYACGFESETHFGRAFRRAFGATPGEVRLVGTPSPGPIPCEAIDETSLYWRWWRALAA
jgi:AraC-like DNA-binding protein